MEIIDINKWKRKQHYEHFSAMNDPFFGVTVSFDVSKAYQFSKDKKLSFFGKYLHDCMKAINDVEALKLRVEGENVVRHEIINASPTIMRKDQTFGFSYVKFHDDLNDFLEALDLEKKRVINSENLYPSINCTDCIHCSALPWFSFTGHKEPVSGLKDSVPKLAFGKADTQNGSLIMNVAIRVNHALVDGHDVGLFVNTFQENLNK